MRHNQEAYDRSNKQLYSAFIYPTLKNDDAILLVNLIDDCVYRALKTIDQSTDWVRRQYAMLATQAAFKETIKSFSSVSDHRLFRLMPILIDDDWLDRVRTEICVYRGHWIRLLNLFVKRYWKYNTLSLDAANKEEVEALELEIDATANSFYGVVAEVKHLIDRIEGILERMARPYLRKLVSQAKMFAREPEAFLDNYQNGYHGIMMAIGRYDTRIGAYAFIVEMWLKSRMVHGITSASNTITVPERIWKHKRILDKYPNLEVEEIAKREKIDAALLRDSIHLLEMRNAMPLIEENDENAEELECYHDRQADREHDLAISRQQLESYSRKLKPIDRIVLSVAFDVDMHDATGIDPWLLEREAARQLYAARLSAA